MGWGRLIPLVALFSLVALPGAAATPARCGVERWDVKTLADPVAGQINMRAITTTVAQLRRLHVPGSITPHTPRYPSERQTYTVTATLLRMKLEADRDIHLVLADSRGATMIAEVPDPACAPKIASRVALVRAAIAHRFGAASATTYVTIAGHPQITVTGVLFFDVLHGQNGVAPNGVELHPVLGLR